jgi:aminoglycoside phosphotransferase family enzyme/predicted kinase
LAKVARSSFKGRARSPGAPQTQEQLIAFLESPQSYPHRPAEVRALQTHISWAFIASPFVFKVKKPVNLGFLDFSTLEKRHYFCQREIKLNRRLCPEIYLGAVPIYKTTSGFSFNGEGEIVEYAVSTDENFTQVRLFVGETISAIAFEATRHFTNQFYAANENLFCERIQQHRILDCHGDLHLDHVHLTPEATTIFDCIEFNDRFRFIDIANDLAFLAMDFDFESRSDLGNLLLRNAARELDDAGMLKVANFYKCYRAFVRGKVESIQATEEETTNPKEHEEQAARYFRLALRYAIAGSEPLILVVMGGVGSGKTTVAKQLASELDWPVFSSDEIRKTLAGVPVTQRTPVELGDKIYSARMTRQTYTKLLEDGLVALKENRGAILDATFSTRALRKFLCHECKKANVPFQFVELDVDSGEIKKRLKARDKKASETSDARLEDFEKLTVAYEPPSELGPNLIRVSTRSSYSDTTEAILLRLVEKQLVVSSNVRSVEPR